MDSKSEEEKKIILLIMNCYRYSWKANLQRSTWLKMLPKEIVFYHVLGNPSLTQDFVFNEEERTLIVKVPDDYNSLPKKVIAAYEAVFKTFEFKYIFKTDDDQDLVQSKFLDTLIDLLNLPKVQVQESATRKPKAHYGGHVVDVSRPYLSKYHTIHPELPANLPVYATKYCSGRFYFLSYEAVTYLMKQRDKIEREFLEDYAIGFNLHNYFKENILNLKTDKYFQDQK